MLMSLRHFCNIVEMFYNSTLHICELLDLFEQIKCMYV